MKAMDGSEFPKTKARNIGKTGDWFVSGVNGYILRSEYGAFEEIFGKVVVGGTRRGLSLPWRIIGLELSTKTLAGDPV